MAVTTQGVPKCLAEKSLLRWKPQLPLNRLEARRLAVVLMTTDCRLIPAAPYDPDSLDMRA